MTEHKEPVARGCHVLHTRSVETRVFFYTFTAFAPQAILLLGSRCLSPPPLEENEFTFCLRQRSLANRVWGKSLCAQPVLGEYHPKKTDRRGRSSERPGLSTTHPGRE